MGLDWSTVYWLKQRNLWFKSHLLFENKGCMKSSKIFFDAFPNNLGKNCGEKSNLHQINSQKVYFVTCFMKNVQKIISVGYKAQNVCPEIYGGPCTFRGCYL